MTCPVTAGAPRGVLPLSSPSSAGLPGPPLIGAISPPLPPPTHTLLSLERLGLMWASGTKLLGIPHPGNNPKAGPVAVTLSTGRVLSLAAGDVLLGSPLCQARREEGLIPGGGHFSSLTQGSCWEFTGCDESGTHFWPR